MILKKLTQDQVDFLQAPFELDLMAYYQTLQEDILNAIDESKTEDEIIDDINKLLS